MNALGAALGNVAVTHRALTSALNFPLSGGAQVVTDAAIEQAFVSAGEQALATPAANSIVIYWLASAGGYIPHAILLDAIEPLWRYRSVPQFTNPIPTDLSFEIVIIGTEPSLEVSEVPQAAVPEAAHLTPAPSPVPAIPPGITSIGSFIVSPGGARTVAMFKAGFTPAPTGTRVTLQLERPASQFYGNPDQTSAIVTLVITPQAPWENDHV